MAKQVRRRVLGSQFIKLDSSGATFTGRLIDRQPQKFESSDSYVYTFESNGERYKMNGTRQLDDALSGVELGTLIEVKFLEAVPTTQGFTVKRFEVAALDEED